MDEDEDFIGIPDVAFEDEFNEDEEASQLLDVAMATDSSEQERIDALEKFLELIRRDASVLLGNPQLIENLISIVGAEGEEAPFTVQVKIRAIAIVEEILCRLQGLSDTHDDIIRSSIPIMSNLLQSSNVSIVRRTVIWMTNIFPMLFKLTCQQPDIGRWHAIELLKRQCVDLLDHTNDGVKISVIRFIGQVVKTQTSPRDPSDPRRKPPTNAADISLDMLPQAHPFLFPSDLENEADEFYDLLLQMISNSDRSQLVNAAISSIVLVVKSRPSYVPPATDAMIAWTSTTNPNQANWNDTQTKSVERSIRDGLLSILRHIPPLPMPNVIVDTLVSLGATWNNFPQPYSQKLREQQREKRARPAVEAPSRRQKEVKPMSVQTDPAALARLIPLLNLDVNLIPLPQAVDICISTLRAISAQQWAYTLSSARSLPHMLHQIKQGVHLQAQDDTKLQDYVPDEQEEEEEPMETDEAVDVAPLAMVKPPVDMSSEDRRKLLQEMVSRMIQSGEAFDGRFKAAKKTWELLLCRLVGRTASSEELKETKEEFGEALKDAIVDFVTEDFKNRIDLAVSFLFEIWWDEMHEKKEGDGKHANYIKHFHQILWALPETLEPGDRLFTKFLLDVPMVDQTSIQDLIMGQMVRNPDMEDREAIELAITTLKEMVLLRPAVRELSLEQLMSLCEDIDKTTRQFAIQTVKDWTPDHKILAPRIEKFALEALPKIAQQTSQEAAEGDTDMATGPVQTIQENEDDLWGADAADTGNPETVRHLDLYLALCTGNPDLLRYIFELYPKLSPSVQRSVRAEMYPVVRALGMSCRQLMESIRNVPRGAETLALKCIWDLLDRGTKPTKELIAITKAMIAAKKMDSKALLAILSYLDKNDIISYLPRIVSLIPVDIADKALDLKTTKPYQAIKEVFIKLITPPAEGERPVLKPEELMIALVNMEDQVGLKRLVPATQICFDLVDLFKPEQLGIAMQQLVESKRIPSIFMRTVLQAVTTYKSMAPFVQSILGRLLQRKVWTTKPLWDGFIRCCRITLPLSNQVLLQLPPQQFDEVMSKNEDLRKELVTYIQKLPANQRNAPRMVSMFNVLNSHAPKQITA